MRLRTSVLALLVCLVASTAHATPAHLWSKDYGDADDQYLGTCFLDVFGNVVICGSFRGSINITTPFTAVGSRDVILAKFTPGGTPMWSARIGFPFADTGWQACSDYSGNTLVAGSVGPTDEDRRAFIARYTPAGAQQWIKYFASTPDSNAYAEIIAVDNEKHIYVAGSFTGSINFGGSTLLSQGLQADIFLAEFDALGTHIWSKRFGVPGGGSRAMGIGVDPAGNVTLFGSFDTTINFGGSTLTAGDADLFLAEFNTNGGHVWSKRFGGTDFEEAGWMDLDPSGRIALTGEMWSDFSFGGPVLDSQAGPDIFLAVLESDGDHLWSKVFGEGDRETGLSVAFASNNDVLLTAYGNGTDPFTFGGAPMSGQPDWNDLYVARFTGSNGAHRWSERIYASGGSTYGFVDETDGQLVLGGMFTAPLDLGGGTLGNLLNEDIFVARFADHITGAGALPVRATLGQNSPNPFNPSTRIEYTLPSPARAVIEIYDPSGAVVTRLDQGQRRAGTYAVTWNGRDATGQAVASGVYFYRLAGMPGVAAKKMVLLK